MVNNPIPKSLRSESKKAGRILLDFTQCDPDAKYVDKIIPPGIIAKAKGLAILTIFKCGFLFTARAGSGLVVCRTPEGLWSAPSALGLAGIGGGFEIGVELTDFVIVLNSQAAVDAFSRNGNVTLGGNVSVAAGPIGRNAEGDVTVKSISAIYTYSKTRGLFAGISLEGSALIERKETNRRFYGAELTARQILSGDVPQPEEARCLYDALDTHVQSYIAYKEAKNGTSMLPSSSYIPAAVDSRSSSQKNSPPPSQSAPNSSKSFNLRLPLGGSKSKKETSSSSHHSPATPNKARETGNHIKESSSTSSAVSQFSHTQPVSGGYSGGATNDWNNDVTVTTLFSFEGEQKCDLSFHAGEMITVITRTADQDDWWEGKLNGKTGIFPANYVKLN